MRKSLLLALAVLPALFGTSCGDSTRELNVYRQQGIVDKQITVKFFNNCPNVPYISVKRFYREFFKTDLNLIYERNPRAYRYLTKWNEYLLFNIDDQTLTTNGIQTFDNHPDYKTTTGKLFIKYSTSTYTERKGAKYNLGEYGIKIYQRKHEVYAPLTLLSDLSGGLSGYDIAYNGKDVYVFDSQGLLGSATSYSTFGNEYLSILRKVDDARPKDLAEYNYNELCFVFDKLRGYTEQLVLGDEKLLSLGLDKLLTNEHPKIKEYLLSTDKLNYYEGLGVLMYGLADGGHTGLTMSFDKLNDAKLRESEQDFNDIITKVSNINLEYSVSLLSFLTSRMDVLEVSNGNYYHYDESNKTALIGFKNFNVDVNGWDSYYKGTGIVPVETDTYAYVRDAVYRARNDGAENLVLDLTTNTGGSSYSLEGILGLFNEGQGYINYLDVVAGFQEKDYHLIDINLDGKWDEADVEEAKSFNFNVGVLTSKVSFSCGNLLPFYMKELGYKTLGERTGGGSCAVSTDTTADGIGYAHSSYICLSDSKGKNVDGGVPVDLEFERQESSNIYYDCSAFYDIGAMAEYLSTAYIE